MGSEIISQESDVPSESRAERLLHLHDELDALPSLTRIVEFNGIAIHGGVTLVWLVLVIPFVVGAFLSWPIVNMVFLGVVILGAILGTTRHVQQQLRAYRERERILEEIQLLESDTNG